LLGKTYSKYCHLVKDYGNTSNCHLVKDYGNTSVKTRTLFKILQIAYCENYRNIPGYGCQERELSVTVAITFSL